MYLIRIPYTFDVYYIQQTTSILHDGFFLFKSMINI